MKRMIIAGLILMAGIALQAQTSGYHRLPDCVKNCCMFRDTTDMTGYIHYNPSAPAHPVFTKPSAYQRAYKSGYGPDNKNKKDQGRLDESCPMAPRMY